jgi:hypothetical protein
VAAPARCHVCCWPAHALSAGCGANCTDALAGTHPQGNAGALMHCPTTFPAALAQGWLSYNVNTRSRPVTCRSPH